MSSPKTLQQAIIFYSEPKNCIAEMVAQRWPDGVVICPTCGRNDVSWLAAQNKWQCKSRHAKRQFSAKVGTIFEDSPLGLDKWLMATWMLSNCKNGVSSYEIARNIGVTQKSAWFMLHRIRLAMTETDDTQLGGAGSAPIEVDETFVGGKVKNMHKSKRVKGLNYSAGNGKAIVLGMLERGGKVRAGVVENRKLPSMNGPVAANVAAGSHLISDEHAVYPFIAAQNAYYHEIIKHVEGYVNGHIHTNGIENFWSCLKRGLTGTYISVEPIHLDRYVDEQVFRFNNRHKQTDATRFAKVLSQVTGKRLTYAEVTGKVHETAF
ncbi:IS1595 family transposase [Granulicella tundricola]|uniref:Unclassified family transposase n=1 Tax=Granulicella tundricola (strain ATCC BAA-1859 / DSM 23138 / MP5ACTX9) TaxID=1198114 RepID=E8WZ99_GRATM|nr:IS1595 family transposase [Granulicella tundricola]ADW67701.1 unclassified family transposase [Granulicella tundricola MP5ACTX9]